MESAQLAYMRSSLINYVKSYLDTQTFPTLPPRTEGQPLGELGLPVFHRLSDGILIVDAAHGRVSGNLLGPLEEVGCPSLEVREYGLGYQSVVRPGE